MEAIEDLLHFSPLSLEKNMCRETNTRATVSFRHIYNILKKDRLILTRIPSSSLGAADSPLWPQAQTAH